MLNVFSTFLSIQGESLFQGKPCFFVRLSGCGLSCSYCDSMPACESIGKPMSIDELLDIISLSKVSMVEVTGGEPLIQKDTYKLLNKLSDVYPRVLLETNGTLSIENVDRRVHVVIDVKCPGSGMSDSFYLDNLLFLQDRPHEIKFVISSRFDFDWACSFILKHGLKNREISMSPVFGVVSLEDMAKWILSGPHPFRLQTQLHKFIWPNGEEEF